MSFITKKHLPRRTFLRGMGVTLALPLLDSMIPGEHAAGADRGAAEEPLLRHLRAARRDDGQVDAGDGRQRLRVHRDAEAAREAPRPPERRQQPRAPAGRRQGLRRRRGSRALGGGVPERRASGEGHRARRQDDRSGAGRAHRPGHAAAVDRSVHRGSRAELRRRLRLRVLQHHLVEERHAAAADGEQPAGRLRAAVRRRQQRRAASVAQAAGQEHPRLGDRQGRRGCRAGSTPATARGSASISTTSARSSGAFRRRRSSRRATPTCPKRRSACPRRSRITSS